MKIFVTGGTGFVGNVLVRLLAATGHQIVALVRPGSEENLLKSPRVKMHLGDVTDHNDLADGVHNCDAIIHLIGIIREYPDQGVTFSKLHVDATRNLIQAANSQNVKRFLHMSANGAEEDGRTEYQRSKWQAEQLLCRSELDWTIFRPSLIFGPESDFIQTLAGQVKKLPLVPVPGDGKYRMQPVAVEQVAETYLKALSIPETIHQTYHLAGSKSYDFNEVLDLVGGALGKGSVTKVHQPVAIVKPAVKLLQGFDSFPLTEDQLVMLLEGNECDPQRWKETFGIEPRSLAEGINDCFPFI